jgi:hypothetical protein
MNPAEKPPDKIFSKKSERKFVGLLIQLSPEEVTGFEEQVLMCFKRVRKVHDKADREVNKIWRGIVQGVKTRP